MAELEPFSLSDPVRYARLLSLRQFRSSRRWGVSLSSGIFGKPVEVPMTQVVRREVSIVGRI
jgi:hypothetical protein